jgi:aminomethyltransferase
MVTRLSGTPDGRERLFLVVNAGTKNADFAHISRHLPDLSLTRLEDRGLIALQGPEAAQVLARRYSAIATMPFMSMRADGPPGSEIHISRCGYTGDDGFEISAPAFAMETLAKSLLAEPEVAPVGLGARDSLRLEAGLCLYGHDIDTNTTPVEAALAWSIGKRRQRDGGFPGDTRIRQQIAHGPLRLRVGLAPDGKAPAREGAEIATPDGVVIGHVTSGGFSPTLGRPIAMGYVEAAHSAPGARLDLIVRGKPLPARIVSLPFVPTRFYRGK